LDEKKKGNQSEEPPTKFPRIEGIPPGNDKIPEEMETQKGTISVP
jgi:hypothetical protein